MNPATIPDVLPMVRAYYRRPGNEVGGSLHCVLEDGNVDQASVRYCYDHAVAHGDEEGMALAMVLLGMSRTQRRKLRELIASYAD